MECRNCGFIFTNDHPSFLANRGMGMRGSWSGPGGGGYREYYLVQFLKEKLGKKSFLLYGTGNTDTLTKLRFEGVDAIGCDISKQVCNRRVEEFGSESFFLPKDLIQSRKNGYDAIVAVEVVEHFTNPKRSFELLVNCLKDDGVICGTTNFYPGGPLEDRNEPGYMSLMGHVAYWSHKSMSTLAKIYGLEVVEFEMVRPGSVLPDMKFGQLFPNKRVFFVFHPEIHGEFFEALKVSMPILPIDRP
jgi:SAM-dependent methyltransferase